VTRHNPPSATAALAFQDRKLSAAGEMQLTALPKGIRDLIRFLCCALNIFR
jgi:hypothetical protein